MKTVAMIPARSGSKGVPDKNIKPFAGKPLLAYAVEAASECPEIDAVYVNSDSEEYLKIGETYGAKSFIRAKELATDDAPIKPVIEAFVGALAERGEKYDAVILLYPIYPLRFATDLSAIIKEFKDRGGNTSMLGVKEPESHPYLCLQMDEDGTITLFLNEDIDRYFRRQSYPLYYELTHWAYITAIRELPLLNNQLVNEKTTGYLVPKRIPVVDIDTPLDFEFGEFLMTKIQKGEPVSGQS